MKVATLLKKKKIAILWFWMEGQSTLRYLLRSGVQKNAITIHDQSKESVIPEWVNSVLWDEYLDSLTEYDAIIKTPWISPYLEKLQEVRDKMLSNTSIFLQLYQWKVIAVTGTKWKSTTSTILEKVLLHAWKKTILLGNIGKPSLDILEELQKEEYEYVIFEMSSFMIESLDSVHLYACIITNIYAAHMDWHHGTENYHRDKLKLAKFCENIVVYHPTQLLFSSFFDGLDANFVSFGNEKEYHEKGKKFFYDQRLLGVIDNMKLLWSHNRTNACAVVALCCALLWLTLDNIKEWIESVEPLTHRLRIIGNYKSITFVDDAISTTPDSTVQALLTMKEENWPVGCLFLGWLDHGFDFSLLVDTIIELNITQIVCFPDSWFVVKKMLDAKNHHYKAFVTVSMKDAVAYAYSVAPAWSVVLLSCAGPSMSVRESYRQKWALFIQYVKELWKK